MSLIRRNALLESAIAELEARKGEFSEKWLRGKPFHYFYVDDFLPKEMAESLLACYPSPNQNNWTKTTYAHQRNKHHVQSGFPEPIESYFELTATPRFLKLMSDVTGVDGLISDPALFGGGLHQSLPGGFLDVHIDYNIHPATKLYRRLNLLVYLNKDWRKEYEGYVELWDMENKKLLENIAPLFNRAIIFETNEISFHGHPKPLKCPSPMTRKSLAIYYYTKERDDDFRLVKEHNTIYKQTSGFRGYVKTFRSSYRSFVERSKREGLGSLCVYMLRRLGRKLKGLSVENK
jgi:Rps23 Pro-64 3,4-dihydroxylase Tpa1-like proline 4-hydroxylase